MSSTISKRKNISDNFQEEDEDNVITPVLDFNIPSRVRTGDGQTNIFTNTVDDTDHSKTISISDSDHNKSCLLTVEVLADIGKTLNAEEVLRAYLNIQADIPYKAGKDVMAKMKSIRFEENCLKEWFTNYYHLRANEYFHIPCNLGYWLTLPSATDCVLDAPEGHTPIFVEHLDCGLRFPLHPFLAEVLCFYNLPLFQLHPMGFRRLIGYLFVCLVNGWEPSIRVWRAMHRLVKVTGGKLDGFYTFSGMSKDKNKKKYLYTTTFPRVETYRFWQDSFLFLRVPRATEHPHFYQPPVVLSEVLKGESIDLDDLTEEERSRASYFDCTDGPTVSSSLGKVPRGWVPYFDHLKKEEVLANAGLCPYLERTDRAWASLGVPDPSQHEPYSIPEAPSLALKPVLFTDHADANKDTEISEARLVDPWRPEEIIRKLADDITAGMPPIYFSRSNLVNVTEERTPEREMAEPDNIVQEPDLSEVHISKPIKKGTLEEEPKRKRRRQKSDKSTSRSKRHRSSAPQVDDTQENTYQDPTDHITKKRSISEMESEAAKEHTSPVIQVAPSGTHVKHTDTGSADVTLGSTTAGSTFTKCPTELCKDPLTLANFLRSVSQEISDLTKNQDFGNSASILELATADIDTRIAFSKVKRYSGRTNTLVQHAMEEHNLLKKAYLVQQTKYASEVADFIAKKEAFKIQLDSSSIEINQLNADESKLKEANERLMKEREQLKEKISKQEKQAEEEINRLKDINQKLESDYAAAMEVCSQAKLHAIAEATKNARMILDKYYSTCVEDVEKKILKFMPNFDWNSFATRFMAGPIKNDDVGQATEAKEFATPIEDVSVVDGNANSSA